jgi:hypothetical protein
MLLIATSDKGGTGRSVTGSNVAYRRALRYGDDVCYVDFDFGSPTAGAVFGVSRVGRGTRSGEGTHSYLLGRTSVVEECDVWSGSDEPSLGTRPGGSGRLVLIPGDAGGGEFASSRDVVKHCVKLFLRLEEEFEITIVDLSAGRSYAAEIVLKAAASPQLAQVRCRWLLFHRWTRQHIIAAAGLVYGDRGLLEVAMKNGCDQDAFLDQVRFVRTAVVDPASPDVAGLRLPQHVWLQDMHAELTQLAAEKNLGRSSVVGTIPLDPMLQWEERLITDDDIFARPVANIATVKAFEAMARQLDDPEAWERP